MTTQQTAYQRMLDWCAAMTDTPTMVEGQRTITRHPEAPYAEQWQGTVDNKAFATHRWKDTEAEKVEAAMNRAIGKVPTRAYEVLE